MNASWIGRGRAGRLAVYAGCTLILIFIMLLYRAASTEINRLRKANELCTHQQESLASQLQIIYDYKVSLEKSFADEKSANIAAKKELQQKATREKSLRDKDSVEALQRYKALEQNYKLLQSENQDLTEELKTLKEKMDQETKKQMELVQQLKDDLVKVEEEKVKSMEHLKSKYMQLENEKTALDNKYNDLLKNSGNNDGNVQHLRKEIVQLKRELDGRKKPTSPSSIKEEKKLETSVDQPEQREQLAQPSPSIQLQSTSTSSVKAVASAAMPEIRTKSSVSTAPSTNVENPPNNLVKVKMKLPVGVVPIPILPNDSNLEKKIEEGNEKVEVKKHPVEAVKNADQNAVPNPKHVEKDIDRQNNAEWMQEVGDDDNIHERLGGFDDAGHQGDMGDDNYDNEFYKERPQKNDEEGEDEREDDVMMDYPMNNVKEKRDQRL